MKELKKLQKQTHDDQRKWRSEKGVLVREISSLRAKKLDLADRLDKLQAEFSRKNIDLEKLVDDFTALKALFSETDELYTKKLGELGDLETKIDQAKAEIDSGLVEYRQTRQEAIDSQLEEKTAELDELDTKIAESITNLGSITKEITDTKASKQSVIDQQTKDMAEVDELIAKKKADAERISLDIEKAQILQEELGTNLKATKFERDQAIADTNKARIEHDQFIKYEQKARDALNAKDRSLQEREDEVIKSSVLMRNSRSNLPPM